MRKSLEEHLFGPGPKRILSLDGGGTRGIITIAYLERIEALLRQRSSNPDFRLCDYFDLIGGTSVGSLLATLIALGYSMGEIRQIFVDWAPAIFQRRRFRVPLVQPLYRAHVIAKRIRAVVKDDTLGSSRLATGLAIPVKRLDTGSGVWLATNNFKSKFWYDASDFRGNRSLLLADLLRASTAAPYYFNAPSPSRGLGVSIDAGVSPHNNLSLLMLMVAVAKGSAFNWPLGDDKLLLISVGTGSFRSRMEAHRTEVVPQFRTVG